MGYEVSWLIEGRVIYIKPVGDFKVEIWKLMLLPYDFRQSSDS